MPRPIKCRRVCRVPDVNKFGPKKILSVEEIIMNVEEYESIRLMDLEGMDQTECAEFMGVARSTFQRIYATARKKIAQSLIEGKLLKIEGGNFKVCQKNDGIRQCNKKCRWENEVE